MLEWLERLILLQIGAAASTRERVQDAVNRLIEQGRMEREEGRTVVNEVLGRARERSAGARTLVDASLQQGLRTAGVPNRESYEDLLFRIEQLEHRVRLLEDRPTVPTAADVRPEFSRDPAAPDPTTTEPVTSPGVEPAMPPVRGVDLAPRPPRDEPETTPGLQPGGG